MLNISEAELSYEGESLELTKNELKILQTLFENKASIVTRGYSHDKAVGK